MASCECDDVGSYGHRVGCSFYSGDNISHGAGRDRVSGGDDWPDNLRVTLRDWPGTYTPGATFSLPRGEISSDTRPAEPKASDPPSNDEIWAWWIEKRQCANEEYWIGDVIRAALAKWGR